MLNEQEVQLCVLAGGKGKRMGADKSQIWINNQPVLADLADRVSWRGPTMLITASPRSKLAGQDCFLTHIPDRYPGEGPLGAILTALHETRYRHIVVMAIDQLKMSRVQLLRLLEANDDTAFACFLRTNPTRTESVEPLPILLNTDARAVVQRHFDLGDRSLRCLTQEPACQYLLSPREWNDEIWLNANHQDDLNRLDGASLRRHTL